MSLAFPHPPPIWPGWPRALTVAGLLLLAPLVGGLAVGLVLGIWATFVSLDTEFVDIGESLSMVPFAGVLAIVFGSPAALLLGGPLHVLFVRLGWTGIGIYIAFGPILAGLGLALFVMLNMALP